jgi:hypothetical protein
VSGRTTRHGIDIAQVAAALDRDSASRNERETPLLASSIERRALASR